MSEKFIQYLKSRDRADGTITAYVADLAAFGRWYQKQNHEAMTPTSVMSIDIREYKEKLLADGKSAATINRRIASLRSFFDWCIDQKLIDTNPALSIRKVRKQKCAPRWLDRKEQRAFIRTLHIACQVAGTKSARFRAYRDYAMAALMLWCGLRRSEVANAEMAKLVMTDKTARLQVLGKGQKLRTVPLNKDAFIAMKAYLVVRGENPSRYVFLSQQNAGLTDKSVYRAMLKYAKTAGVKGMTPHSLRHTFGKSLVDKGVSLEKIAQLMGHESLNTTAIYLTPSEQDLMDAVAAIAWTD